MKYGISIDKTVEMFNALAGEVSADSAKMFCRTAAATLESYTDARRGLASHDTELCYAAACMAFFRYALKEANGADTVKVGDVTVTDCSDSSVKHAEELMKNALEVVEPLFKPKRFAFLGTGAVI